MDWNPTFKPRLRPLEAFRLPEAEAMEVGVRDRSGLSNVVLTLSPAALQVMALMDGAHTCEDIRCEIGAAFGQPLAVDSLRSMLTHLESAHMLEGPAFEEHYESLVDQYRSKATREMPSAAALGILDDSGEVFEKMLAEADTCVVTGRVRGLIAPHLDYPRGGPCYAAAHGTLRQRPKPDRVIILGTNHFGRSTSVVATASAFSTPLGTTRTDVEFLEHLEARCGNLRQYELDHAREHSIELQVAWLQHLFGADRFTIVPLLCPDPCGPTGTAPADGKGVNLRDFADALGELLESDTHDTLIVAGADLSHVGAEFGDERTLDDTFLGEVNERDRRALKHLELGDPEAFLQAVAENENPTRICSAGCIFVLAKVLGGATATILRYHQAVDQSSQTCVTCTAAAFT